MHVCMYACMIKRVGILISDFNQSHTMHQTIIYGWGAESYENYIEIYTLQNNQ